MAERVEHTITLIDKSEYDEGVKRRLLQSSLAEGTIYLLMFELRGETRHAGSVPFQFDKIIRNAPLNARTTDGNFLFSSRFLSDDYRPTSQVYSGVFTDGFVAFDNRLTLGPPVDKEMGRGIVVPDEDDIDSILEAVESLDESLALSN